MENPAVIVDIKCEAMEVESPNIDLDSWSWNSAVKQEASERESNWESSVKGPENERNLQEYPQDKGKVRAEQKKMEVNQTSNDEPQPGVAVTETGQTPTLRNPIKKAAKQSVKVVVWRKNPQLQEIKIDKTKVKIVQPEHLFVVKYSHSDDKENNKARATKKSIKQAVAARLPARNSSKSLKRNRRKQSVQVSTKQRRNYRTLLDSYISTITSQRIAEGESQVRNTRRSRSGSSSMDFSSSTSPAEQPQPESFSVDPSNAEHAFTVDLGGIVDDVAHFEQVECPGSGSVSTPTAATEPKRKTPPQQRKNCSSEISFDEQGKPRCTYTELIERALTESGGLTVSEIYQWISDRYSFFQPNDDRWKNSVRHNLSINPYFKKGDKARSGAGHLWTISEESRALRHAVRKKGNESQEISMSIENETDRAVASILGQYNLAKANMEVGGQQIEDMEEEDNVCENVTVDSSVALIESSQNNIEDPKVIETPPNNTDYANMEFPGAEFTIELGGVCIPEIGSVGLEELISSGRLVFIQAGDDQDADKENMHCQSSEIEQYMVSDFSELHNESQATERVSGQLISEALTQEFSPNKPVGSITPNYLDSHNIQEMHFESQVSTPSGSQDFMTLESIDPIALQDVLQVTTGNGSSDHYHSMSGIGYENRNIGYSCNYDNQVIN